MTDADRVLIVEDEVMLALELGAELQSMGITVCGMAHQHQRCRHTDDKGKAQPRNDGCSSGRATGRRRNRAMA